MTSDCTRPVAMWWHGAANATPRKQDASFLSPMAIVLYFSCFFIIIVAPEICPEIMDKLSLYDILEISNFSSASTLLIGLR